MLASPDPLGSGVRGFGFGMKKLRGHVNHRAGGSCRYGRGGAGIFEQAETQGVNYRLINRKLNLVQKHFIMSLNNFGDEKTI